LHDSFAENPRHSIKYSTDVIAQDDSESVGSLAERVTNSDNDSDPQMFDLSGIDSQDAVQDDPAISMGTFGAPNEHSTMLPHPRVMVMPLDTSLVGLEGPRLPRETLEEQHQDSGLQSRGDQDLTQAEQLPISSFSKYQARCDPPSQQNLQIGLSIRKTPCHRILSPSKSILKQRTERFPRPAHYEKIEVAPRKDSNWDHILPKLSNSGLYRTVLDPEALTAGEECFFPVGSENYVARVLSEENTKSYKFFTEIITGKDSMFSQSPWTRKN
jgi:hypothetical protein